LASLQNGSSPTLSYLYDANGNITSITEGANTIQYEYNELNGVIRENNQRDNTTFVYHYDLGGNLTSKVAYAYTTGTLGTPLDTTPYVYGDTNWKDLLTSFDGKVLTYDAIGNPLTYDGGTFAWEGRKLTSFNKSELAISYTYNENGIRTSKTVNGLTTNYRLSGDKVTFEQTGSDSIYYVYDTQGQLLSMLLNGVEYAYLRNAQNDIVGLIDGSGNQVVSYTYSTWGEVLSVTGSLAGTLGAKNPYRYRGYQIDSETGLYYLQSRYYNPQLGRFLNADNQFDENAGFAGNNFFTYCANNPIIFMDHTGASITLILILIGTLVGASVGGYFAARASKQKLGYVNGWWVVGGILAGGGTGALIGWSVGAAANALGAALTAGSGGTLSTTIYANWQSAEQALRNSMHSVSSSIQRTFSTPWGNRIVDAFNSSRRIIAEAKYGYQGLSQFIQTEIARDSWLLQQGKVNVVEWHFYISQVTGKGGPTGPLLKALLDAGIKVIFH
jgi:RHS repeat-associated protein